MLHKSAGNSRSYDDLLFITAASMAYCGFLRVSELCGNPPSDPSQGIKLNHLSVTDNILKVFIQNSKTDQTGDGATIHIPPLRRNPCPIRLLCVFLKARPTTGQAEPLFIHANRSPMTGNWFRKALKDSCSKLGLRGNYNSHSLRIGAASDAAARGVPSHTIKSLGRWKSNAFERYIRPSGNQLALSLASFATV